MHERHPGDEGRGGGRAAGILRASRVVRWMGSRLNVGLTPAQLDVLDVVRREEGLPLHRARRPLLWATTSRPGRRMGATAWWSAGVIRRDRRVIRLFLGPAGREASVVSIRRCAARTLAVLSQEERAELVRLLRKVVDGLGCPCTAAAMRRRMRHEQASERLGKRVVLRRRAPSVSGAPARFGPREAEAVKEMVHGAYGDRRRSARLRLGQGGDDLAEKVARHIGYGEQELSAVPEGANLGLGCGNPTAIAGLQPGETVLDLGSGGGFDCFLAARRVGEHGKVIGVDMTPEMVERARHNARQGGFTNVEFRLGEIEALPVADASVDVVISNCVLNLVPDKARAFRESPAC